MSFEIHAVSEVPEVAVTGLAFYAELTPAFEEFDGLDYEALRALNFEGKTGQVQPFVSNGRNFVAVGLGAHSDVKADTYRRAAAQFVKSAAKRESAALYIEGDSQAVAEGLILGSYKFLKYKSAAEASNLAHVYVVDANSEALSVGEAIARAVSRARDMINEPAADMTPTRIGEIAQAIGTEHGLRVEVWDERKVFTEHLGGLLGVARGSSQPPRLIKMFYEPEGATKTIALVGKGITFDSGGLSIKSGDGMMTMKTDMSGAAAVITAMSVIPRLAPDVRVVAIAAATENLIGPSATKPGDVLKARNGKTMEVLNTDAEGRLVLADALSLAVEDGADVIVDVATLTGAAKVALGPEIGGVFGNNEEFTSEVMAAADAVGEPMWQLPLYKGYRKFIDSDIADIKNIGPGGAGATTAALFLQEFVSDKPWVHLDIAGPARADGDNDYISKGGTGFAVRTLIELVRRG